jgi:hypothetical protein
MANIDPTKRFARNECAVNILDIPILSVSERDQILLRQLVEGGTLILGMLGSGKSSTSLRQILLGMMRAGMGGLLLTVKPEDTETFVAYARECGREADVVVFNEASGLSFDPLAYEWSRPGRGAGDAENIIEYFQTLLSVASPQQHGSADRFWELAAAQAMRHAIKLIQLAGEPLSIGSIHKAIRSFPTRPAEHEEPVWAAQSYTAALINAIRERKHTLSESQWRDLEVATEFVFSRWPSYDEKPRGSIEMTFSGMADKFLFYPFREIFSSGTYSFTPEQTTHERRIIIVDFPVLQYGQQTARLIQTLVKLTFQRAWLRHKFTPGCCNGAFLIQDEFQLLMHREESHFVQVCRSSGIAPVFLTQSILNLAEEMNEPQPGSKTKAFLNNLAIKIGHRSVCPETCSYLADVIGKEYRFIENYSAAGASPSQQQGHASVGGALQLAYIVEPTAFTKLEKPDGHNPHAAAIVHCGGSTFNVTKTARDPNGRNYLHVLFSRE